MKRRETRTVQHKESGEKSELKKTRELRAENQKLRRQLSRMRKQATQNLPEIVPDEEEIILQKVKNNDQEKCPDCGSIDIKKVKLTKTLTVCKNCGYRKME